MSSTDTNKLESILNIMQAVESVIAGIGGSAIPGVALSASIITLVQKLNRAHLDHVGTPIDWDSIPDEEQI
jgi:hypothetical protein